MNITINMHTITVFIAVFLGLLRFDSASSRVLVLSHTENDALTIQKPELLST